MTNAKLAPTDEQQAVIDAFEARENLVIEAGAGTGKTATLQMLTKSIPSSSRRKAIYVTFSKAMADEAKAKFPRSVDCRTAHSLAFTAVGKQFSSRLGGGRQSNASVARQLGIDQVLQVTETARLTPGALAGLARATTTRFMQSADPELGDQHLDLPAGRLDPDSRAALREVILPAAERYWRDQCDPDGRLPYEHDAYLKLWQLSRPRLESDLILFDEAQDANGATADILTAQHDAQLVAVGDSNQQLYQWRGAVNALEGWPADQRLYLTQSWRFGQAVADEANRWLAQLDTGLRLKGAPSLDSRLGRLGSADAVLCRTNKSAFAEVIERVKRGQRVALVGNIADTRRLVDALCALKAGRRTDHAELLLLPAWSDVVEYAKEDDGRDLRPLLALVEEHPHAVLSKMLKQVEAQDVSTAEVVVSTAHRSKGRQWPRVIIADDFPEPQDRVVPAPRGGTHLVHARLSAPDAMLAYVAITRAELELDRGGLAWIDRWEVRQREDEEPAPLVVRPIAAWADGVAPSRESAAPRLPLSSSAPASRADWPPPTGQPVDPGGRSLLQRLWNKLAG